MSVRFTLGPCFVVPVLCAIEVLAWAALVDLIPGGLLPELRQLSDRQRFFSPFPLGYPRWSYFWGPCPRPWPAVSVFLFFCGLTLVGLISGSLLVRVDFGRLS